MNWKDKLPDVGKWQPQSEKSETLSAALEMTCQAVQSRIVNEANIEEKFSINNYDVGPGLEDIVRQELSKLLPQRYSVDAGVVNDKDGKTAGDCDVLITNRIWASVVKLGATPESRRVHFPIESIYSVVEVKRTLGFEDLDEAMKKLVTVSRLTRPKQSYGHITENQHIQNLDRDGHILNPLWTTVLATKLKEGVEFRDVARRFGQINARLNRDEMVKNLYVLGHGAAWYSPTDGSDAATTFMSDGYKSLQLKFSDQKPENIFYIFFVQLSLHLMRSILKVDELFTSYGPKELPQSECIPIENAIYNSGLPKRDDSRS